MGFWGGRNSQSIQKILRDLDELSLILRRRHFHDIDINGIGEKEKSFLLQPFEEPLPINQYWAIFVGVSNYAKYPNVPSASKDAWRVANIFLSSPKYSPERAVLFTSEIPTDDICRSIYRGEPTDENILDCLEHFSLDPDVQKNDLFLFYFSGHGVLDKGAYLAFGNSNPAYLQRSALLMSELKLRVQNLKTQVKVIVLDTCHSASVLSEKGAEPMSEEFKKQVFNSAEGLAIFTSCDVNQKSYFLDDTNQISVFTHYVIEGLEKAGTRNMNFVTANDLSLYLTSSMLAWVKETDKIQIPKFHWVGKGDPKLIEWE